MDWKNIVSTVAPILGHAIGGPLGAIALKKVADALGLPEGTEEAISAAVTGAKPEDLLKLKQADQQFARDMRALDVNLEEIAGKDRDSARRMATETKAYTPAVLSWLIVLATLALEGYVLVNGIPADVNEMVAGRVLGTLDTAFVTVLTYWLGSSARSAAKDSTITHLSSR